MNKDIFCEIAKRIPYRSLGNLFLTCKSWYLWASSHEFWATRLSWECSNPPKFSKCIVMHNNISKFMCYKYAYVKVLIVLGHRVPDSEIFFGPLEMLLFVKPSKYFDNLVSRVCFDRELKSQFKKIPTIHVIHAYRKASPLQKLKLFKIYPTLDFEIVVDLYKSGMAIPKWIINKYNGMKYLIKHLEPIRRYIKYNKLIITETPSFDQLFFLCYLSLLNRDLDTISRLNDDGAGMILGDAQLYMKILNGNKLTEREINHAKNRWPENMYLERAIILYLPNLLSLETLKNVAREDIMLILKTMRYGEHYQNILDIRKDLNVDDYIELIDSKVNVDLIGMSKLIIKAKTLFNNEQMEELLNVIIRKYPALDYIRGSNTPELTPKKNTKIFKFFKFLGKRTTIIIEREHLGKSGKLPRSIKNIVKMRLIGSRFKALELAKIE